MKTNELKLGDIYIAEDGTPCRVEKYNRRTNSCKKCHFNIDCDNIACVNRNDKLNFILKPIQNLTIKIEGPKDGK